MSPEVQELREDVDLELSRLHALVGQFDALLNEMWVRPPNPTEAYALAGILHSLYTGLENILKRIAVRLDEALPRSQFWHRDLLRTMSSANEKRPAVLSESTYDRLKTYLDFRHVFRQAYGFDLQWEKMKPLVLGCKDLLVTVEAEVHGFLGILEDAHGAP